MQQLLVVTWDRITFPKQFATFFNDGRYLITVCYFALVTPSGDQKKHILISWIYSNTTSFSAMRRREIWSKLPILLTLFLLCRYTYLTWIKDVHIWFKCNIVNFYIPNEHSHFISLHLKSAYRSIPVDEATRDRMLVRADTCYYGQSLLAGVFMDFFAMEMILGSTNWQHYISNVCVHPLFKWDLCSDRVKKG